MAIKPISPADRMAQRIAALRRRMNRELDEILAEYLATVPPEPRKDHPNRVVDPLERPNRGQR